MKITRTLLLFVVLICFFSVTSAQKNTGKSEFQEYVRRQRAEFESYKQEIHKNFENYRDSINREYASFLEQKWKVFDMQKEDPPIKTPVPAPPVYDPSAPKLEPEKTPVITPPQPPLPAEKKPRPQPDKSTPPKKPLPVEEKPKPDKPVPQPPLPAEEKPKPDKPVPQPPLPAEEKPKPDKPVPQPPLPAEEKPKPGKPVPQPPLPAEEKPQPKPVPDEKQRPQPTPTEYPVKTELFGTPVALKKLSPSSITPLSGVSEKDVASYWSQLSQQPYSEWSSETERIRTELNLNDWAMYLFINKLFDVYFPSGTANEKVVFTVFMLNQLGYRAKVGRNQNELVPLIAFANKVHYMYFFRYNEGETEIKYSALNPEYKDMSSIRACDIDYPGATRSFDMKIENMPRFATNSSSKTLKYNQNTCTINYNQNLVNFYSTYPCVEFSVYAEAPFDQTSLQNIESQIAQDIRNKSQEEAVNLLLHFVQRFFEYQTDTKQYGHERWLFAEETLVSKYSDCEDRSILFAQLVRRLLGMKVVLIYYPGVHLATAVKFDNPQTDGDHVIVDGTKYLICDPTYMGASLGAAMPKLAKTGVEVTKLKDK
jgi:hypothetical protein